MVPAFCLPLIAAQSPRLSGDLEAEQRRWSLTEQRKKTLTNKRAGWQAAGPTGLKGLYLDVRSLRTPGDALKAQCSKLVADICGVCGSWHPTALMLIQSLGFKDTVCRIQWRNDYTAYDSVPDDSYFPCSLWAVCRMKSVIWCRNLYWNVVLCSNRTIAMRFLSVGFYLTENFSLINQLTSCKLTELRSRMENPHQ